MTSRKEKASEDEGFYYFSNKSGRYSRALGASVLK